MAKRLLARHATHARPVESADLRAPLGPERLPFLKFMATLSNFDAPGARDAKLKLAFRIQDFDADGVLGRDDLRAYYGAVIERAAAKQAEPPARDAPNAEGGVEGEEKAAPHDAEAAPAGAAPKEEEAAPAGAAGAAPASGASASGAPAGGDSGDAKGALSEGAEKATKEELVEGVVDRILEEASSHPFRKHITYDDFQKILGATDFENKLQISFLPR